MDNRLWKSDCQNGKYINPVLFADYSDPDVIRVEDTYYMTASSFSYTPGLPILISKDLVNWKLVNYAIDNLQYEQYNRPLHSKGVWAPSIRYHKGEFYIYYGMPDEGIFMVKSKNPLGKWEKPVCVLEGKGLIDPCPYWEKDEAYVIHGYAKSRIGFKSILGIFKMSLDGKTAISEDKFLFDGQKTQPTIEGPKVYKRNGYYYIFAPAGGVRKGWQTVLRSKNIYGPYEERIVMEQKNSITNGPHQGAWVDTKTGEDWFLHFQDMGFYGRVMHLQPMRFCDDWPVIGLSDDNYCGKPVLENTKPKVQGVKQAELSYLEASDDFEVKLDKLERRKLKGEPKPSLQWQWTGNHNDSFYSLTELPGFLILKSINPNKEEVPSLLKMPNILTQKIVTPCFIATTRLYYKGLKENEQAGMCMIGGNYAYVAARNIDGVCKLIYVKSNKNEDGDIEEEIKELLELPENFNNITLCISLDRKKEALEKNPIALKSEDIDFGISYAFPMENFRSIDTDFVPVDDTWVGSKLGLFSYALDCEEHDGIAAFEYFGVDSL